MKHSIVVGYWTLDFEKMEMRVDPRLEWLMSMEDRKRKLMLENGELRVFNTKTGSTEEILGGSEKDLIKRTYNEYISEQVEKILLKKK